MIQSVACLLSDWLIHHAFTHSPLEELILQTFVCVCSLFEGEMAMKTIPATKTPADQAQPSADQSSQPPRHDQSITDWSNISQDKLTQRPSAYIHTGAPSRQSGNYITTSKNTQNNLATTLATTQCCCIAHTRYSNKCVCIIFQFFNCSIQIYILIINCIVLIIYVCELFI